MYKLIKTKCFNLYGEAKHLEEVHGVVISHSFRCGFPHRCIYLRRSTYLFISIFPLSSGVGLITRKAANAVTPTVELKKDGDSYNLVTSSTFKTTEMKFKPGEEFDEDRADGAKVPKMMVHVDQREKL